MEWNGKQYKAIILNEV